MQKVLNYSGDHVVGVESKLKIEDSDFICHIKLPELSSGESA